MKIIYVVKNIDKVPSCQYNILILKELGYDVIPVLGKSTNEINEKLMEYAINPCLIPDAEQSKIKFIFSFRNFVNKYLKFHYMYGDIVFLGTADTAVVLSNIIKHYPTVLCIKELYDHDKKYYQHLLMRLCRKATTVVACEKNRSRYMRNEWKLNDLPLVIPNKPYMKNAQRNCVGSTPLTQKAIQALEGKRAVLYQANHIHYAKELIHLATALKHINENYVLVLMGNIDNPADLDLIKSIYPDTISTGYIKSPLHMEITSNAYIGITVYQDNSLNNLFCAPNKIFEYSCFGIPTLANDVPGLIETVGLARSGICVDWSSIEQIEAAIRTIANHYSNYEENAISFFSSVDSLRMMNMVVEYTMNKIRGEKSHG